MASYLQAWHHDPNRVIEIPSSRVGNLYNLFLGSMIPLYSQRLTLNSARLLDN